MKCPRCQAQNREGAQFCRECGTRFGAVCPTCGTKVEGGSKFCDACGATLSASPAPATRLLLEHAIAAFRTGNVVLVLPFALASSAWVLAQLGEATGALNRLREGEELLERHAASGIFAHRGWADHTLGRASLLLGRLDEARRLGNRAVKSSPSQHGYAAHVLHLLGDIATHPDRFDAERGEAHYRQALALAEPRGMRPLVAHCHLGLGRLYRRTGKRQEAQEHLTTATTMYREMDMRFWLEQVELKELG